MIQTPLCRAGSRLTPSGEIFVVTKKRSDFSNNISQEESLYTFKGLKEAELQLHI